LSSKNKDENMRKFIVILLINYLSLLPQNVFSIDLNSDPYSLMSRWATDTTKQGKDMADCVRKTEQLAKRLSKTKDCQSWKKLWLKEMACAVKSGLTPEMIGFCWEYNNNPNGAKAFYQTLIKKYGKKQCDYDDYRDKPVSCSEFGEKRIARLRLFMDYSKSPSDSNKMVTELLNALKKQDKNKILRFFTGRGKETIDYEPDAPICSIQTLINERMPNTFTILYRGYGKNDPMHPRQKSEQGLPCIQSGNWKNIGVLSFQTLQLPPRLGEPPRYYFEIFHGGCVK
jgi:hypothetical protein